MTENFKYYVIHNLEKSRYENITSLLKKYGVDIDDVNFINYPNKNELTYDIKKKVVQKNSKIKDGWISCSYKHYLALEMIVNNQDEFAVIMEDNIGDFFENIPARLNKYLEELPDNWDVVYDSVWGNYEAMDEERIKTNKLIYSKSNKTTTKLYENFIPFNHSADMWMNDVLRKIDAKSFWSEPSLVVSKYNTKTSTDLSFFRDFFYILKTKIINFRLQI